MSVSAGIFRWTEAYRVNIEILDRQHQELIDTINELDAALRAGEGNSALPALFDKLIEYANEHFAAEESLMLKHEFPGVFTHQAQHEIFRQKLDAFISAHNQRKSGVPVSLMLFLHEWLKDHLLKTDKLYSPFLNARGVR